MKMPKFDPTPFSVGTIVKTEINIAQHRGWAIEGFEFSETARIVWDWNAISAKYIERKIRLELCYIPEELFDAEVIAPAWTLTSEMMYGRDKMIIYNSKYYIQSVYVEYDTQLKIIMIAMYEPSQLGIDDGRSKA